jgi:nitrite reductase/ring-hydroxylating ferredoxin subunit/Fe-S cluster biogenesis protein NfuA
MGVVVARIGRVAVSHDALPPETAEALDRLDALVQAFEDQPDENVRDAVFDLLRAVDVVHRQPLAAVAALLQRSGLSPRALADRRIALLFDLYDLGEGGERRRADGVLDGVRPYIESHGGKLDVLDAEAGVVTVRLAGACAGCQGSTATLKHVVEDALRTGLDDFVRLEVVDPPRPTLNVIPAESILPLTGPRLAWRRVLAHDDLDDGAVRSIDVEGNAVLLANVGGEIYAYRSACPGTPLPLDGARAEDDVLVCPWHGCRFSLRDGRRVNGDGRGLDVMPVAVAEGEVRVGVLAAA